MVEQRVLIPSVQVRVPVPQPKYIKGVILSKLFTFFIIAFLTVPCFIFETNAKENYGQIFLKSLLKWGVNFKELENNKAGAACIKNYLAETNDFEALGFSFKLYDIKYAKKVAITGCNQMKKKKNLTDCTCETIIVNDEIIKGN